ncbi:hypothetical protein [Nocardiopsis sp. FR26]|nr:hypothetical protein [Nocardiopsis sp. FR26]
MAPGLALARPGRPPDLRPVGVRVDRGSGSVTLSGDQEFRALLDTLVR